MSRLLRMLGVVLGATACLAPPATLAVLIGRFGVNIPYTDQWELVLLMQKERRVGLTFGDLVAQHGEQRMVFPRIVMLALARLTNWNIRAELLVSLLLAAGMMIILFWMLSRSLSGSGKWLMIPVASASLMIFSPVQWENWLWGWAIGWFLTPLCLLVAVAALAWWPPDRPGWPAMIVAMGAAVVGQYSLFNGTLIWLTCLPIMAVRKHLRRFIGIWVAAGGTLTALYLFKHQSTHWERFYPSLGSLVRKPQRPVEYLSYFLGRPVLDNRPVFWVGGSLLLLFIGASAYLVALRRDRLERGLVWFSVGSYALLTAVMTMLGRLNLGLQNAGASRYTTVGILLMIATAALISVLLMPGREGSSLRTCIVAGVWLVAGTMFVLDYPSEVKAMKESYVQRVETKKCLQRATSAEEPCLSLALGDKQAAFERSRYLKRLGWAGLAQGR